MRRHLKGLKVIFIYFWFGALVDFALSRLQWIYFEDSSVVDNATRTIYHDWWNDQFPNVIVIVFFTMCIQASYRLLIRQDYRIRNWLMLLPFIIASILAYIN